MNLKTKIVLLALHNTLENKKLNVNDSFHENNNTTSKNKLIVHILINNVKEVK